MKKGIVVCSAAFLLLTAPLAASAQSQSSYDHEGPRTHNPGFMLRLTSGIGYGRTTQRFNEDTRFRLGGPVVDSSAAIGFALSRGFAVHGTVGYSYVLKPKVTGEIGGFGTTAELDDARLAHLLAGGGITLWMGGNTYLTTSVGGVRTTMEYRGIDLKDDAWGLGGELLLGKEWFLGSAVGLGVAVGGSWHITPAKGGRFDDLDALRGFTAGARLSLTFN